MDAANATILKLASGTRVQNILGSSEGVIKPSAKQYWAKAIALQGVRTAWPARCSIHGCSAAATHGSHVKIRAHSAWGWFVIPACPKHNRGASNDVRPRVVSACELQCARESLRGTRQDRIVLRCRSMQRKASRMRSRLRQTCVCMRAAGLTTRPGSGAGAAAVAAAYEGRGSRGALFPVLR